jgi:DNA-binding transcriptional LysR family regulator
MNADHEDMELQQLRYAVEIAATSSFTRAAERCFVTQSALSHQIGALERELGERLFIRTSRSVRPTEAGEAFVVHARAALASAESAREAVTESGGKVTGTLRIGVIPTVAAVRVPQVLAAFRRAHPEVRVELAMGNSDALALRVRRGELDIALLGLRSGTAPAGVEHRLLGSDRHVAVLPEGHRLAGRRRLRLADLEEETFVDFPAGTSGRAQSDVAFSAAGVDRDVAFEVETADVMVSLVAAGLAVTLLTPGAVTTSSGVTTVPLLDGPSRTEFAVWEREMPRRTAEAFLRVLHAELAD